MRPPAFHATLVLLLAAGAFLCPPAYAGNGTWTSGGPYGKSIKDLLAHPTNQNILYAGSFGMGVYKSTDGGITWRSHRSGFRNSFVRCLAMDAARPETLYAGTNDGLYRSVNGDSTWTLLLDTAALANPTSVRAVTLDPFNPGTIYAGTFDVGIFKSIDYGAHWTPINLGLTNTSIRSITIHPANPDTVLAGAGTGGGVFISGDGGLSWTQCSDTAATASAAQKIVYDPQRTTRIYVATASRGVMVTNNGGVNWSRLARGLTSFLTRSLAVIDTVRYVGTDSSGVFFATLSETLWHAASSGLSNRHVDALLARSKSEVWAGTDGGALFHTVDAGASWSQVDGGLLLTNIFALGISPTSSHVYSGAGLGDQFWWSTNMGGSWTRTAGLPDTHGSVQAIANDAGSPSTVYQAITNVGVLRSLDYGVTWINPDSTANTLNQSLAALVSHPVRPGVLYVGTGSGVYKSINGGASWALASSGLPANAHVKALGLNPTNPDTVFAGTDSLGLYRSLNGGSTWSPVGAGITSPYIRDVRCDPATPGVVYAATDGGVFRSADHGATWAPRNTGLPAAREVRSIACDAAHPNVWFAGVWQAGVFWSANAGLSWFPLLSGLGSINVSALAVDAPNATVYAGTQAGTYQYTNYSTVSVQPGDIPQSSFRSWPNPFHDEVVFRFAVQPSDRLSLDIFDVAGRRVRRLLNGALIPAGPWTVAWEGRDDRGSRLPEGVYLARLRGATGPQYLRLVLVW
jgi:photosystem II stability/assembly factor-like uncharacterized protein